MIQWNMEEVKIEIEVDGHDNYIVTTDTSNADFDDKRYIESCSCNAAESSGSNPFGICGSRSYNLSIMDVDDLLSPTNTTSEYYNIIKNGSKVNIYIEDTEAEDEASKWKKDGVYYINSIGGGFQNGFYTEVNISCQDKLDNIGSKDNPKIPCYRNIKVVEFLNILFSSMGLIKDIDWKIDEALGNRNIVYGITVGEKIRDTLNALAQYLQARIMINRDNIIVINSASQIYGKQYELPYDLVNSANNIYASNTNCKDITVNYNIDGYKVEDVLLNDSTYKLQAGANIIEDIRFNTKAISIRHLTVQFDRYLYESVVNKIIYRGYQDGLISLEIDIEGDSIENCLLYAEGMSIEKSTRKKTETLLGSDENGTSMNLDIKYVISEGEAGSLINGVKNIIDKMSKQITIKTYATPHLDIGDEIDLVDEDYTSTYIGKYKLIKYQRTFGANYTNVLTLISI